MKGIFRRLIFCSVKVTTAFIAFSLFASLSPGNVIAFGTTVSVNTSGPTVYANPGVWGVNYEGYSSINTLSDFYSWGQKKETLQEMNIRFVRYPGGCPADFYDFHTDLKKWTDGSTGAYREQNHINIDELVQLAKDINAQVLYQVNVSTKPLADPCRSIPEYPPQSLSEAQKTQLLLNDIGEIATTHKNDIRYWELGNEQWQWADYYGSDYYFSTALLFAEKLKSIDPTFKVGLIGGYSQDYNWTNKVVQYKGKLCVNGTVPCFDFVTDHPYSTAGPGQAAWYPLEFTSTIDTLVAPLKLAVTEWNLVCWTGTNTARGTIEHGFYTGEFLALMAKRGVLLSSFHDLGAHTRDGCAMVGRENNEYKIFPAGEAFKLTSILMGTNLLDTSVSTQMKALPLNRSCSSRECFRGGVSMPYVSLYIGKTTDNQKYQILMFNRHETEASTTTINGLPSGYNSATQNQLTAGAYTELSFQSASTSFAVSQPMNITLPPLSITAITLTQSDLPTSVPTPTATPGILGDINGDGVVNIQDFVILSNNFGSANSAADLNRDGVVNIQDFVILSNNFGKTTPPPTPTPATPTPPVLPTPGTSTPTPTATPYCRGAGGGCKNYPCCPGLQCIEQCDWDTCTYRCQ